MFVEILIFFKLKLSHRSVLSLYYKALILVLLDTRELVRSNSDQLEHLVDAALSWLHKGRPVISIVEDFS